MRAIDAERLYHIIADDMGDVSHHNTNVAMQLRGEYMHFLSRIVEAPIVDAQPITYCKDCKHYNGKRHKCQITYNYHGQKFFRGEYDYCSKGEKWGNNGKGD